eukprot:TRINITY_DN825_c1_g1_i2.p1 TRINITY_DN825_c1_g1~~TRINITY_DN825_c1_g1_i2.p1  ORF type:complete len:138 (+),score=18.71 TRINITY_DN825_c1_g1_i2:77-490(+)
MVSLSSASVVGLCLMVCLGGSGGYRVKEEVQQGGVEGQSLNGTVEEESGSQICYCTVDGKRCILGKSSGGNGQCNTECIKWCTSHLVKGTRRSGASAGCFSHIETSTSSCSQLGYRIMRFAGGKGMYWTGSSWAHAN